jgi:hypothetical protein
MTGISALGRRSEGKWVTGDLSTTSAKTTRKASLGDDPERKVQTNVLRFHRYKIDHHPNHYKRSERSVIGKHFPTLSKLEAATKPRTLFCSKTGNDDVGGPGVYGHAVDMATKMLDKEAKGRISWFRVPPRDPVGETE